MSNGTTEKIKELEFTNLKLIEEYKSLNRNYEAICVKLRDEKNLVKRLQDELKLSFNKELKNELTEQINNYKEKYEKLADSINGIETKLKLATQNCIKYQENELNYKRQIKNLEGKLRSNQQSSLNSKKISKQNEEKVILYRQENQRLEKTNTELLEKIEELNKKMNDNNIMLEQTKKENEIIYKLLDDSKSKLKETQKAFNELNEKVKLNKQNNIDNDNDKYKKLYEEALKTIENTKKEKIFKIIKITENDINIISNNNCKKNIINFEEINDYLSTNLNLINEYDSKMKNKIKNLDEKINKFIKFILNKINKNNKDKNNIQNMKDENLRLIFENSKLKMDNNNLNEKIKILSEKEAHSVDLNEIKKLFTHINTIINRLKLTMESIWISLKCKNCYKIKTKMFQLQCGHSICNDCVQSEKNCNECENEFDKKKIFENKTLSNVIIRYNYAEQQINSDIDLVIKTLNEHLDK